MLGIDLSEIIVILIIALLVFDIENLPKIARSLGKVVKEFRKVQKAFSEDSNENLAG